MIRSFVAALALALSTGAASAAVYTESPDAGAFVGTAQNVTNGTDVINGTGLYGDGLNDVDVYRFGWNGGALTISTASSSDPVLYLFGATGLAIQANDDALGLDAQLSFANLVSGDYFLAIAPCCSDPLSAGGSIFGGVVLFGNNPLPVGPGAGQVLTDWGYPLGAAEQPYSINFSAAVDATVSTPEPASLAVFGFAMAGMAMTRRRRAR